MTSVDKEYKEYKKTLGLMEDAIEKERFKMEIKECDKYKVKYTLTNNEIVEQTIYINDWKNEDRKINRYKTIKSHFDVIHNELTNIWINENLTILTSQIVKIEYVCVDKQKPSYI